MGAASRQIPLRSFYHYWPNNATFFKARIAAMASTPPAAFILVSRHGPCIITHQAGLDGQDSRQWSRPGNHRLAAITRE